MVHTGTPDQERGAKLTTADLDNLMSGKLGKDVLHVLDDAKWVSADHKAKLKGKLQGSGDEHDHKHDVGVPDQDLAEGEEQDISPNGKRKTRISANEAAIKEHHSNITQVLASGGKIEGSYSAVDEVQELAGQAGKSGDVKTGISEIDNFKGTTEVANAEAAAAGVDPSALMTLAANVPDAREGGRGAVVEFERMS
ncbi:MAG: hypothetical protein MRY32_04320 [Rickettsiales bacterium]|nr:hypothetical protein [Rickettsiales bacterium]